LIKVSRDSSSDEDVKTGDDDRIGSFFVVFTFEDFFRGKTAGAIDESEEDEEGGLRRVYQAGGAKTFLMYSPIEPSDEDEDENTSGFILCAIISLLGRHQFSIICLAHPDSRQDFHLFLRYCKHYITLNYIHYWIYCYIRSRQIVGYNVTILLVTRCNSNVAYVGTHSLVTI
jgi:hypothetical protein